MNRKMKRFLTGILLVVMMMTGMSFSALAARIAFSDPSVTTGDTVTVNMRITSTGEEKIGSADVMLSYDSTLLEFVSGEGASGGAGSVRVTGSTNSQTATELAFTLTFRALRAGNATISIASQEVYNADSQIVTVEREGSSAVTIAAAAGDSTNAKLAGLQISPGTLSPAFSPDVENYTATVTGDVTSIVVDAPAVDSGARVSVIGNDDLQEGENQIVCTVTAQDGQTVKTYTITVTRLAGTEGAGGLEDSITLKTPERSVTVRLATDGVEIPEGFISCSVSIDGHDVQGWIWGTDSTNPQYCIFYATNENGDTDFYRYDLTEKTLQRYFRDPLVDMNQNAEYTALANEYNLLLEDYNTRLYIIIGLIALAVVLLIAFIVLVATRGGGKDDFYEKRQDGGDYPQRRKEERQRQAAAQAERRRISREERYMRGMEEEEDAAEQEEMMRAERQSRERQAQRQQARAQQSAGNAQRQGGQRQAGAAQSGQRQRQAGAYADAPQGQRQASGQRAAAGQRAQTRSTEQIRQAGQTTRQNAAPGGQNYVVRGPLPGDDGQTDPEMKRAPKKAPAPQTSGNGQDDDFDFIDLGI